MTTQTPRSAAARPAAPPLPAPAPGDDGESGQQAHRWVLESRHLTGDGVVRYWRCDRCRARCVELVTVESTPSAVSRVVDAPVSKTSGG
ncbi:hypothetical protein [Pseudokineococcus sp. 1T1Z-3]|uniref:hypothetical protein n=1 Tax=Pseudokineococcus sp. 1T1Z-3 TaxID=3132745 RepID=UPI003095B318